ncbi:hypothetical protein LTR94_011777 [Friedmanniomyces endolithicus]|nr:hypothetical protein LTR94_011777 [Friedmanniomyces endolithicus]
MGRKTWESLPLKPLPGRLNLVLTKDESYEADGMAKGAVVCSNLDEAIEIARETAEEDGVDEICIIGGTALFAAALPRARRLYITEVDAAPEGDAVFPSFDETAWVEEPLMYVATTNDLPGFRVTRHIGLVRGVTVRSRNAISDAIGGVQSMLGGRVGAYVKLAEAGRQEAYDELVKHAQAHGANAILAVRYDATEIMPGVTEVLCYGTAVIVEPA